VILATVKGDVHDIGKNIVSAVLESHGWEVVDLGKNVEAELIVATAVKEKAQLIGLSALMTTTMLEMEKVIRLRNEKKLKVKVSRRRRRACAEKFAKRNMRRWLCQGRR